MLFTEPKHALIPIVPFIPPILHHLHFPYLTERREDTSIIRITHTYQFHLAFVLER